MIRSRINLKIWFSVLAFFCSIVLCAQEGNGKSFIKTITYNIGEYNNEAGGIIEYQDFSTTLTLNDLFSCPTGSSTTGYFSSTLNITNNILSISFGNSGTYPCQLKLGFIKQLATNPTLPNMDLGPINIQGDLTSYYAKIINGALHFYSPYYLQGINGTYTKSFVGTAINDLTQSLPTLFTCNPAGGGGSTGTISLRNGNTVILDIQNAGWSPTCNLKTGDILTLTTSSPLPDIDLGRLKYHGWETAYSAKIESNVLKFHLDATVGPAPPSLVYYPLKTFCLNSLANTLINTESVTYYDEWNRPTLTLAYNPANKRLWGQEYNYDEFGRLEKESYPAPLSSCSDWDPISFFDSVDNPMYNYYSNNNAEEPFQAIASFPYNQAIYDNLNPVNIINVVGGNKIDNEWKTGFSYTLPAAQELYYLYGKDYFEGVDTGQGKPVVAKFYKTVNTDANGTETIIFQDSEGRVLAEANSGGDIKYSVVSLIDPKQRHIDVHIPKNTLPSDVTFIGGQAAYEVYNLKTGSLHTGDLVAGNIYRIVALPATILNADTFITAAGGITYGPLVRGIEYKVNYYNYNLNCYNKAGLLVKNVQPQGIQSTITIPAVPTHMNINATNYITTYKYDSLNNVTESQNSDEGLTKFLYRKDGNVRYVQNELQRNPPVQSPSLLPKMSYIEYDAYSRPVESGILETSVDWATINPNDVLIAGTKSEQSFTIYDAVSNINTFPIQPPDLVTVLITSGFTSISTNYVQKNLEGRVSITYSADTATSTVLTATWYSYDIYGRLAWTAQYINGLGVNTLHYYYDAEGNVETVTSNLNKSSELFTHHYSYNESNVLTKVQTNTSASGIGTLQAEYEYYLTGELKRTELAGGIQGLDYVYTIDGQLKSINSTSLQPSQDPGGDTNDLFGLTLDYYDGDYVRNGSSIRTTQSALGYNTNQYNGNVKAITFGNRAFDAGSTSYNTYMFNYDSNNWLKSATFGLAGTSSTGALLVSPQSQFKESNITYDANGNILSLQRSNENGTVYDNFSYAYENGKNRLSAISDTAGSTIVNYDLDSQSPNNYLYNSIGQLITNVGENLSYTYNSSGLVTEVRRGANPLIKLYYNERNYRVKKETFATSGTYSLINTTYYVPDLTGNIVAVYSQAVGASPVLIENSIYGLDRIGVVNRAGTNVITNYEIKDHLGSVRAVFQNINNTAVMQYWADYYPFGEQLPSRNSLDNQYRYAFQGQEKDTETGMEAFQLRMWDGRIGRWLSPDPYGQYASPYLGMGNNPSNMIDPDGGHTIVTKKSDGTYAVTPWGNADDGDNGIYLSGRNGSKGQLIGYSATPYSFYNTDEEKFMGTINPNDQSGRNFLNKLLKDGPDKFYYAFNATGNEKYDFKTTNGTKKVIYNINNVADYFRGMPILGKHNGLPIYASARDIGNIGAGLVAGVNGHSWYASRKAFDGLESWQRKMWVKETRGTVYGQRLGWNIGTILHNNIRRSARLPGDGGLEYKQIPNSYIGLRFKQFYARE